MQTKYVIKKLLIFLLIFTAVSMFGFFINNELLIINKYKIELCLYFSILESSFLSPVLFLYYFIFEKKINKENDDANKIQKKLNIILSQKGFDV